MKFCIIFLFVFAGVRISISKQPNIVLLLNDDQDDVLGGEIPMKFTKNFFKTRGGHMKNFFVNTPVCCPSRATLISGRYPHNYLAERHEEACMGMDVSSDYYANHSIGIYMSKLGYTNGHFGKYFNTGPGGMGRYCDKLEDLPGFDQWFTMCQTAKYYDNPFVTNMKIAGDSGEGTRQWRSGEDPAKDYLTSLIGNMSVNFIKSAVASEKPFFAYIAPHAPHVPATPAAWYQNAFENLRAPRTPNYNYTATDHHYVIRQQDHLDELVAAMSDELFRNRWRSLLSVDDIMIEVVKVLTDLKELDNTYFIWTSDHGYQLGQFNLPSCKLQPYEHDLHVPLHIAGPGVKAGAEFQPVASMVDVAPTLIELGGGTPPDIMDGQSFADVVTEKTTSYNFADASSRDRSMIEYWSLGDVVRYQHLIDGPNNTYIGARVINSTHNILYVEFYENKSPETGEKPHKFQNKAVEFELFDLNEDFYQMKNLYGNKDYAELTQELHEFIHSTVLCSGQSCRHPNSDV
jgi:N-acetylglucosamine-6-sulfatase